MLHARDYNKFVTEYYIALISLKDFVFHWPYQSEFQLLIFPYSNSIAQLAILLVALLPPKRGFHYWYRSSKWVDELAEMNLYARYQNFSFQLPTQKLVIHRYCFTKGAQIYFFNVSLVTRKTKIRKEFLHTPNQIEFCKFL